MREPSAADPAARFELLQQARRQHDEGALSDAWQSVSAVADLSRRAEDPVTLADAATLIRPSHNFATDGPRARVVRGGPGAAG